MKLWIDTEFNDFLGDLISVAIVDEMGREFYCSLGCDNPTEWVAENVIPVIGIKPTRKNILQFRLECWLQQYDSIHVISDWPEDVRNFCQLMITGPGERINTPETTFEINRNINSDRSAIPHNALEDAKALKHHWMQLYGN